MASEKRLDVALDGSGMSDAHEAHQKSGTMDPDCAHCLVRPKMARSAKYAWIVTGVTVLVLVAVLLIGATSQGGVLAAGGGLVLIMVLACPLMMGGMMWMMMRMGHQH
jgi:hypothetical protein